VGASLVAEENCRFDCTDRRFDQPFPVFLASSVPEKLIPSINHSLAWWVEEVNHTPIGIIPPSIDESLEMFSVFHLILIFLAKILVTFRLCGVELREIAGKWMASVAKEERPNGLPFIIIETTGMLVDYISSDCVPEMQWLEWDLLFTTKQLTKRLGRENYITEKDQW
jgi:hypothetical protein